MILQNVKQILFVDWILNSFQGKPKENIKENLDVPKNKLFINGENIDPLYNESYESLLFTTHFFGELHYT